MFKVTVGETVKFSTIVSNMDSTIVDPAFGIKFMIKNPAGFITTYVYGVDSELIKDFVGKYSINLTLPTIGVHKYRWETGTPAVSIKEDSITVVAAII
jgi:hypothetical protein